VFADIVNGALCGFGPPLDFGTPYLGKGLGYIGIAVALVLVYSLIRYKVR
jgi:hypothetical protein